MILRYLAIEDCQQKLSNRDGWYPLTRMLTIKMYFCDKLTVL